MDDCKEIFAMLSEYLDAELTPQTCADIEAHLAGCPPCIEFVNSLKKTVRLCHDCPPAESPAPLSPADKQKLLAAYQRAMTGKGGL